MGSQFDFSAVVSGDYGKLFVIGVQYTFVLFGLSWVVSMSVGTILAVLSLSRTKVLRWLVAVFVAYHRNVPLLVQLMLWYFAIPRTLPTSVTSVINSWRPEVAYAVIALSLCCGAYIAEDIRSGLRAIPRTQFEASRSIGFSRFQSMRWVILPQAFRLSLPSLINDTLDLFKSTSIAAVIGVGELTYQMRLIENETFRIYEVFIVVSAIYFSVTIPFMILAAAASRHAALYRK